MTNREMEFRKWCLRELNYHRAVEKETMLTQLNDFFKSTEYQIAFKKWDKAFYNKGKS